MRSSKIIILSMLSACHFVEEGVGDSSSSTGVTGGEENPETFDPSVTTTLSVTSTSTTSSASNPTTDESSSDDVTTSEDDATTTHGESSTGEDMKDWALSFDGTSHARKLGDGGVVDWTAQDFTVETWIDVQSADVTGVIFDASNIEFNSGWVLYFHAGFGALVFSFFDGTHYNQVVVGPAIDTLDVGWHHLSATKSGYDVFIHVDGALVTQQTVPTSVAQHGSTIWSLGGNTADLEGFRLKHASLDDVRVTASPRYDGSDFDPSLVYDADTSDVLLLLRIDEGDGDLLADTEAGYLDFSVTAPVWVTGNSE